MMSAPLVSTVVARNQAERVRSLLGRRSWGKAASRTDSRWTLSKVRLCGLGAPTEGTLFETVGRLPALPVYSPWWKLPEVSSAMVVVLLASSKAQWRSSPPITTPPVWQAPPWQVLPGAQSALLKQVTPQAVPWQR